MAETLAPEVVRVLVESHERFLRFVRARVPSREAAEDVLQAAFVKTLERGEEIRDSESAIAWFYRVLRNAIVDHHRHRAVEARALKEAQDVALPAEDAELERAVCECLGRLIPTLKPEYAELLRKVELEGMPVAAAAAAAGITPNNAMVRLHRARKALQTRLVQTCGTCTEHGCLDCSCPKGGRPPGSGCGSSAAPP